MRALETESVCGRIDVECAMGVSKVIERNSGNEVTDSKVLKYSVVAVACDSFCDQFFASKTM